MRHTIPEIRHARFRVIERRKKLIKEIYHTPYWRPSGELSHGKVHCSCPKCAAKTNARKLNGKSNNWKISDIKKIERMDYDLKEYLLN